MPNINASARANTVITLTPDGLDQWAAAVTGNGLDMYLVGYKP